MSDLADVRGGRPWGSLIVLIALGGIHVFLFGFIVPKFEQIYQDALPGVTLPGLTRFVIEGRLPLALIAVAWTLTGSIMAGRRHRAAGWVVGLGVVCLLVLVFVTVVALFRPMTGLITGAAPGSSATSGGR